MASPPSFSFSDDDDEGPSTAGRLNPSPNPPHPHAAAAPTPNGLNDRLLRFTQNRHRPPPPPPPQNPSPDPLPPTQGGEDRKVKLAGRRRLCKVSSSPPDAADEDDGDNIRDILDDLSARLDSILDNSRGSTPRCPAPSPQTTSPTPTTTPFASALAADRGVAARKGRRPPTRGTKLRQELMVPVITSQERRCQSPLPSLTGKTKLTAAVPARRRRRWSEGKLQHSRLPLPMVPARRRRRTVRRRTLAGRRRRT